jgi:hypothetical protein
MNAGIGLISDQCACAQRTQDDVGLFPGTKPLTHTQATIKTTNVIDQITLKEQGNR